MKKFHLALFVVVAGLGIAIAATAFTNPTGNPPTGNGALYYSGGNVGIGTPTPIFPFQVVGIGAPAVTAANMLANTSFAISTGNSQWADEILFGRSGGANNTFWQQSGKYDAANSQMVGYTYLINPIGGNVGINTTNPIRALTVNGEFSIARSDNTAFINVSDLNGNGGGTLWLRGLTSGGTVGTGIQVDLQGNLNIIGGYDITGVNKITVNTIDPIFKINNQQYATYAPDSVGQKVEIVGEGQLVNGETKIDLASQPKDSDLWFFWQIVKPGSIIPFVSSQSDANLYAFMDNSQLVVRVQVGDPQAKFSYRLNAERIDAKTGNALLSDTKNKTYIDVDCLKDGNCPSQNPGQK